MIGAYFLGVLIILLFLLFSKVDSRGLREFNQGKPVKSDTLDLLQGALQSKRSHTSHWDINSTESRRLYIYPFLWSGRHISFCPRTFRSRRQPKSQHCQRRILEIAYFRIHSWRNQSPSNEPFRNFLSWDVFGREIG